MEDLMMGTFAIEGAAMSDLAWDSAPALRAATALFRPDGLPSTVPPFFEMPSDTYAQWGQHDEAMQHDFGTASLPLAQYPGMEVYQSLDPWQPDMLEPPIGLPIDSKKTVLYSKEQWEAKKDIIKLLWIIENRTWKSVEETLRLSYNFPVTRRQFTRKTEEWGFSKNVRLREMKTIDEIERKRVEEFQKRTSFQVRGQEIPGRKLKRWRRRRRQDGDSWPPAGCSKTAVPAASVSARTPAEADVMDLDISYHTPKDDPCLSIASIPNVAYQSKPSMVPSEIKEESFLGDVKCPPAINIPTSDDSILSEAATLLPEGNTESFETDITKQERAFGMKKLDGLNATKLARLLKSLQISTSKDLCEESLALSRDVEDTVMDYGEQKSVSHPDQVTTEDGSRSAIVVFNPMASLSPFRNGGSSSKTPRNPKTLMLPAWCLKMEIELKKTILHLARTGASLEDRLPRMSYLALILNHQSKYKEAERIYRQVAVQSTKINGQTHVQTLVAYYNTVEIMIEQGQYLQAKKIHERLQITARAVLRSDDELLRRVISHEALLLLNLQQEDDAKTEYLKLIQMVLTAHGCVHDELLTFLENLAIVLYNEENYDKSEEVLHTVIGLHRSGEFGSSTVDEHNAMRLLAKNFSGQGRHKEGEQIIRSLLEESKELFGPGHEVSLALLGDLSVNFFKQGRYGESKRVGETILGRYRKLLGTRHPNVLRILSTLANSYYQMGNYENAATYTLQWMQGNEKTFGEKYYLLQTAHTNLGILYNKIQNYNESLIWLQKAYTGYRVRLGDHHLQTLIACGNLGWAHYYLQNYAESLIWLEKAYLGYQAFPGDKHLLIEEVLSWINLVTVEVERIERRKQGIEENREWIKQMKMTIKSGYEQPAYEMEYEPSSIAEGHSLISCDSISMLDGNSSTALRRRRTKSFTKLPREEEVIRRCKSSSNLSSG